MTERATVAAISVISALTIVGTDNARTALLAVIAAGAVAAVRARYSIPFALALLVATAIVTTAQLGP